MREKRSHLSRTNPFRSRSLFNLPLQQEQCQQIHAAALRRVARGWPVQAVPSSVNSLALAANLRRYGSEVCLEHPDKIEWVFQGMTMAVYQMIESLYCSRLARSVQMTQQIMQALAQECGCTPLHEEAVWAICLYLDERRAEQREVTVNRIHETWWIGVIAPYGGLSGEGTDEPILVGIMDLSHCSLLAFRVGESQNTADLCSLALYDALCSQRHPHSQGASGLLWDMPTSIQAQIPLPERCTSVCASLGIQMDSTQQPLPQAKMLGEQWAGVVAQRKVSPDRWAMVFDSFVNRRYGTSPLRAREQAEHLFRRLIGYTSDPAVLVPELRTLLTPQEAVITHDGEIAYDGLQYTHDLLALFAGRSVLIRRSESTEAMIWVYLDGEILSEAMARELARHDGSYRSYRKAR